MVSRSKKKETVEEFLARGGQIEKISSFRDFDELTPDQLKKFTARFGDVVNYSAKKRGRPRKVKVSEPVS